MIEKMQKVTFITKRGDMEAALQHIADAGVLHIPLDSGSRASGDAVLTQIAEFKQMKTVLPKAKLDFSRPLSEIEQGTAYAKEMFAQIHQHEQEIEKQKAIVDQLKGWGNFDCSLVTDLSEHGFDVQFYVVLKKQLSLFAGSRCWIIQRGKQNRVCVIAAKGAALPEEIRPVQLPQARLSEVQTSIKEHDKQLAILRKAIAKDTNAASCVATYLHHLEQMLHSMQAREACHEDEALEWITGFVPVRNAAAVDKLAKKQAIGLYYQEINEEDPVPTKLKKNIIANTAQPIFDVFGTIPGYKEFDIRTIFLLFFTLFFAMIVSDAGYATLFLGIAVITLVRALILRKNRYAHALFFLLSLGALSWGALSGSWFGDPVFLEIPFLNDLVLPYLWVDHPNNNVQISLLCMTIGTLHICIAHLWRAMRALLRGPRLQFFGECGWIALLLGLYYLVLSVVIDATLFPIPPFTWPLVFTGLGFILLFGAQDGKFFIGIFKGISSIHTIVLDAIGMFSDIISYIRLYAVGLASLAVARSFAEMAESIAGTSPSLVLSIVAIVVLMFGHGLNIGMTALSVVVHGVRLNMLEFSRHLGMEWNGIMYRPLKSSPLKG